MLDDASAGPRRSSLSIVIPLYKTASFQTCLESSLKTAAIEIIVVDSSPLATSLNVADERIRYIHLPSRHYPGDARNIGAKKARGDWLLFLDADVELTETTLEFLARQELTDPGKIIYGVYDYDRKRQGFYSALQTKILKYRFWQHGRGKGFPWSFSSHFLIHRQSFWEIGGFHLQLPVREDQEFCIFAKALGFEILVCDDFSATHHRVQTLARLLRWDYSNRTFHATTAMLRHPEIFRRSENLVPKTLAASWLSGPLIMSCLIGYRVGLYGSGAVFASLMATAAALWLLLCRDLLVSFSLKDRVHAIFIWPLFGTAISISIIGGYSVHFYRSVRARLQRGVDAVSLAKRALIRSGHPLSLVHFLTARCNLRCSHCFYKETLDQPDAGEMDLEKINSVSSELGPLLWYAVGGGEPFLRKDLETALSQVAKKSRPWIMTIPTNGWYTDQTYISMRRFVEANPNQKILVSFSVDGPQDLHDQIRGKNSWTHMRRTYTKLRLLADLFPQLSLGLTTVVTKDNLHTHPGFIDQLVTEFRPRQIGINLYRDARTMHQPADAELVSAYRQAVDRYQSHLDRGHLEKTGFFAAKLQRAREIVQKKAIAQIAETRRFITPCVAGSIFYVLWEDGRIAPCEMLDKTVGNVYQDGFLASVKSKKAQDLRSWIAKTQCRCTYECSMTMNSLFSWPLAVNTFSYFLGQLARRKERVKLSVPAEAL